MTFTVLKMILNPGNKSTNNDYNPEDPNDDTNIKSDVAKQEFPIVFQIVSPEARRSEPTYQKLFHFIATNLIIYSLSEIISFSFWRYSLNRRNTKLIPSYLTDNKVYHIS